LSHEAATELSRIKNDPKAITFQPGNEMAFMPEIVSRMTSGNMNERLAAFKTISHEWWHAMKTDMRNRSFTPFEEGGADLFSESIIREKTGARFELNHALGVVTDVVLCCDSA
jgi:hypothetical protein